ITKWVQVTDNDYMDVYAYVWVDPGKQGGRALKGKVGEADQVAPKLLSAVAIDDRRVLLTCSEPVQAANAKVTLQSGTAATKLSTDSEERGIIAEFAAPLAARETLTVTGVTDRAQAPNKMAAAKAQIVRPDWPSNLAGLCYLWKNARTRDVIFDERIRLPVTTALNGGGQARFNREGAAMAAGGAFDPGPGSAERILEGIKKTHQFSFEIVVASADLKQTKDTGGRPVSIFQWGNDWGEGIFWLLQEKNLLQVALGGESRGSQKVFEMATLPDTKPHHVIVSVAPKRLAFYLDGKKVKEIDPSPAQLLEVGAPPMTFAGYRPDPGKNTWHGTFEYVAMYNRFIEEDEAAKNAAAVAADLAKRTTLPRIEVQATLIGKSKIPDPRAIAPYRNALIVNEYEEEKVLKGTYAGKTIRVAQWGMLDLKPTPLAALEPGASVKLVLENFADHEELVSELISDTLKEDFDLKLYTDVNL
ncbi:MAG TPA: LamG-like jellyroll fold domain-containing protein, partial [Planctomycetota bacterium]|nr:LamG-like jellyroll fold domain-containing protein [Planctomycetota bacterium]